MKKILQYAAAMAAVVVVVVACNEAAFDEPAPEVGGKEVTVTVATEEATGSRVSIDDAWAVKWDERDALLAIAVSGRTSKFEISTYDAQNPTFSGTTAIGDSYNLIYPYSVVDACTAPLSTTFDLDLTTQSAGTNSTYLISEEDIDPDESEPTVKMMHVGAAVELDMQFTGYAGYTIESLEVSGLNSNITIDARYPFGDSSMFGATASNTITITDGATVINDVDGIAKVRFNIFETVIGAEDKVRVNAYLMSSEGKVAALTKSITAAEETIFDRAKYHTLRCGFSDEDTITYADLWTDNAATDFAVGHGSSEDPIEISTAEELALLASQLYIYSEYHFKLTADIDLTGHEWVAIGNSDEKFTGTFDGDGHKITGLYINQPEKGGQGLFGYVMYATIKNLSVSGSVTGAGSVGGVVGRAYRDNNILNCANSSSVTCSGIAGGIVGYADFSGSNIFNCYNSGPITGNGTFVGGIIGNSTGATSTSTITNCYNSGSVTGRHSGGIAGCTFRSSVTNCYNIGSVEGSDYAGGIVGYADFSGSVIDNSVINCYWEITTANNSVGGGSPWIDYVVKRSTDYMKSSLFVDELNNNAYTYNNPIKGTAPATKACAWVSGTDGYPTLDFGGTPELLED